MIALILFVAGLTAGLIYPSMLAPGLGKPADTKKTGIVWLLLAGLLCRLFAGYFFYGHENDMHCFTSWADMVFEGGFSAFYTAEGLTDYPPGYMYVLYFLGAVRHFVPMSAAWSGLFMKLPAILCDVAAAGILYKLARRHCTGSVAYIIAAVYLFNPAVFVNSAMWGQVDSVFTLLILCMVILLAERRLIPAYFLFALSILVKPQALFLAPVMLFGWIEQVILEDFSSQKLIKHIFWILIAVLMDVLLALPFGLQNVVGQYVNTVASYPYMTVNAYNIWAAFGGNWADLNGFGTIAGYIVPVLLTAAAGVLFFRSREKEKYYYLGAFMVFMMFMLSVKMHERYAFPAMALLLACFAVSKKGKHFLLYALFSASQFWNIAYILFVYETNPNKYYQGAPVIIASIINIGIMVYFCYETYKTYYTTDAPTIRQKPQTVQIQKSAPRLQLGKWDWIVVAVLVAVYGAVAFYDLGDRQAPETETLITETETVELNFGEEVSFGELRMYLGPYHLEEKNKLILTFLNEAGRETDMLELEDGDVFFWTFEDLEERTASAVQISTTDCVSIKSLALYDGDGNLIEPINKADYPALFDEQTMTPQRSTFRNSTYFDEIYHARTAYEFLNGLPVYEWTHPPLGKVFIAAGIKLFGMNPFGWRFVGTLFGVLMIPVLYLLAKRLLRKTWLAAVTCVLFTFDFMHFAQTRIATIDVYVTFFIMLMYYWMLSYMQKSFYDTPLKKTFIPLGLCGISMGMGIACKWTGVYAGVGLAVLFFWTLYKRYREYCYACQNPAGTTSGIAHQTIIKTFRPNTVKTILFCCIFFVVIPLGIYLVSYIPYLTAEGGGGLAAIWENQQDMLTYHGKTVLDSTHPYSSRWYQWPVMWRPIWYYSGTVSETIKEGISSFGNPLVWWIGIPAFFYVLWTAARNRDKKAIFLCVGYLAQLLPWTLVFRTTYIYHYFPAVPFVVLMLGYSIKLLYAEDPKIKRTALVYAGLTIGVFILFYPVLSGQPIHAEFVRTYLRWIPGQWTLI